MFTPTLVALALSSPASPLAPPWGPAGAAIDCAQKADRAHRDRLLWEYGLRLTLAKTEADREAIGTWATTIDPYARRPGPEVARGVLGAVVARAADPRAIPPLAFVATSKGADPADVARAVGLLRRHHLTHPEFLRLTQNQYWDRLPWLAPVLREQLAEPDLTSDERHRLAFSLAKHLKAFDATDAGRAEALELFGQLARDEVGLSYLAGFDGPSIADLSRRAACDLTTLSVGCRAPELAGTDLGGVPLKLSEFRGKVVLLAFGTTDCSCGGEIIPALRKLGATHAGRPFAVVGAVAGSSLAAARSVAKTRRVPWRSVWCGDPSAPGGIFEVWNVESYPTLYLIDHAGVVRAKGHAPAELVAQLEALVAGAERAAK